MKLSLDCRLDTNRRDGELQNLHQGVHQGVKSPLTNDDIGRRLSTRNNETQIQISGLGCIHPKFVVDYSRPSRLNLSTTVDRFTKFRNVNRRYVGYGRTFRGRVDYLRPNFAG